MNLQPQVCSKLRLLPLQLFLLAIFVGMTSLAHAMTVPLKGNNIVPLSTLRQNNPAVLPLTGTWRFQLTHGQVAADGYRGAEYSPATASSSPCIVIKDKARNIKARNILMLASLM